MNKIVLSILLSLFSIVVNAQISVVNVTLETTKGATIGLDDEMSTTNVFTKEVVSGQHTLVIKYNNEVVKRENIDIPAGAEFKEIFSIGGKVNINSEPSGIVSVDGKDFGPTPTTVDLLGSHAIKVRYQSKKYKPSTETLNVLPLENIDRMYELKKSSRPWKYSWMLLPQVTLPTDDVKDAKFGFMVARARIVGWYIKGTVGWVSMDRDYSDSYIWPTGKHKVKYMNICGGFMLNIFKPLYLYGGGGFGVRHTGYEDYGGTYYHFDCDYYHFDCDSDEDGNDTDGAFVADFGLLFNFGRFVFNGGCSHLAGKMAVNIGVGIKI